MKGVSEFISYSLVILLAVSATAVVITIGLPTLQRSREVASFDMGLNNMQQFDSMIMEVASEGQGSSRAVQINVNIGKYSVTNNSLVFTYYTTKPFIQNSTAYGNIRIMAGYNTGNLTLQYSDINITGSLDIQSGSYRICMQNMGAATVNVNVC